MYKKITALVLCVCLLASAIGAADIKIGYDDVWQELGSKYYMTNDNGKYYITSDNKEIASKLGKVYIPALAIVDQNGDTVSDKTTTLNVGDSQTYYVAVDSSAAKKTEYGLAFYSSKECIFYLDTDNISWASTGDSASRSRSGAGATLKGESVGNTRLVAEIPICVTEYIYGEYSSDGYDVDGKVSVFSSYEKEKSDKHYIEYDTPRQETYVLSSTTVDAYINVEKEQKVPTARNVPYNPFTGIDLDKVENPFIDVSPSDWYYEAVMYLYAAGILNGVDFDGRYVYYNGGDVLARKSGTITTLSTGNSRRAMTALSSRRLSVGTITPLASSSFSSGVEYKFNKPENRENSVVELYNSHKKIGYSIGSYNNNPFTDVKNNTNSYQPIIWASNNGIVNGYGNGKFGPYDHITREQFCAILVRHSKLAKIRIQSKYPAKSFTDGEKISSWASSDVVTCQCAGIIQGYPDGSFRPQGEITRAEMATMLVNYLNQIP